MMSLDQRESSSLLSLPPDGVLMMNLWPQCVCVSDTVMYVGLVHSPPTPLSVLRGPDDEALPRLLPQWDFRQSTQTRPKNKKMRNTRFGH